MRVEFDQAVYRRGNTIRFQVVVEGAPSVTTPVEFVGSVTLPGGELRPVTASVNVTDGPIFGAFAAAGYEVTQDPYDPSRYTATPESGGTA
ncbi:hypothetical protein [Verrucosispora sp. NA02020]|uniref:hypothetical protein n=1 Tax=Verrucosispora sp. NA02020 TaxID=2742132 RepID=UPI00159294CD|nr:hypothetical protein [Verrucosispora sp. NA02020]QKW15390.1 hypothetical protein HUT12_23235 [Verrucosispora sp. NA02020]